MSIHVFLNSACDLSKINIKAYSTLIVGFGVSLAYASGDVPQTLLPDDHLVLDVPNELYSATSPFS